MPFGKIAGLAAGIFLAEYFIFPRGIVLYLHSMTVRSTDLARLSVAIAVTIVIMALGHVLDR